MNAQEATELFLRVYRLGSYPMRDALLRLLHRLATVREGDCSILLGDLMALNEAGMAEARQMISDLAAQEEFREVETV
ncbi:MAG: hypothetical protein IT326_01595 [Anaerolineae bacterium]|nr:hypothetical protein [Anaerolineae bacterium]